MSLKILLLTLRIRGSSLNSLVVCPSPKVLCVFTALSFTPFSSCSAPCHCLTNHWAVPESMRLAGINCRLDCNLVTCVPKKRNCLAKCLTLPWMWELAPKPDPGLISRGMSVKSRPDQLRAERKGRIHQHKIIRIIILAYWPLQV